MSDPESIYRHALITSTQAASVAVPQVYVLRRVLRKGGPVSANSFFRFVGLGTLGIGFVTGSALGFVRANNVFGALGEKVNDPWLNATYEEKKMSRRLEDYSLIGAFTGSLATTAVFLKRAKLPWLLLGGASIGMASGVFAHFQQLIIQGSTPSAADSKPEASAAELSPR